MSTGVNARALLAGGSSKLPGFFDPRCGLFRSNNALREVAANIVNRRAYGRSQRLIQEHLVEVGFIENFSDTAGIGSFKGFS